MLCDSIPQRTVPALSLLSTSLALGWRLDLALYGFQAAERMLWFASIRKPARSWPGFPRVQRIPKAG